MTLRELAQLVALGEGQHIEFKQRVPDPYRIAKEVIAFANTGGGRLLLGVTDDGDAVGVRDAAEEEFALQDALSQFCSPAVSFKTERVPVSKKRDVIIVHVPMSHSRPHYLLNGKRVPYIRVDDMSVEASREAIRVMKSKKEPRDVVFEFGEKERALMRYLDNYGRISVEQFAKLTNISRRLASHTLVLLTKANVLQLHSGRQHDYFTLAYSET